MADLGRQYRDHIVDILDRVLAEQATALDAAIAAVAAALAADKLVYVAGSGHSHLIAEEVFYRAGGIAAAQAILDPDLMLHLGAERSTLLEREEGRAAKALLGYPIGRGDVVFVVSNSGRNAYPIEMALAARERGATAVALTSLRHASSSTSRHSSGKLLYQVADIVIDNGGEYGDAMLPISGREVRMVPSSTIAGVFILNTILAQAVEDLARRGVAVDVYQSANMQGAEADTKALIERWRQRIQGL
jgi:uncharacterized phosphosugar-binding protein